MATILWLNPWLLKSSIPTWCVAYLRGEIPWVKSDGCIPPWKLEWNENVYFGIAGIYEAICETRSFFSTWIQVILSNFLKFGFWHPNLSQFCDGKIHGKITMVQSPCARQTATHLLLVKSERQGQIPLDHGRARFLLKWVFILVVSQWSFILMSIIFHLYAFDNLDIFISM